jgi:hypothetical protein
MHKIKENLKRRRRNSTLGLGMLQKMHEPLSNKPQERWHSAIHKVIFALHHEKQVLLCYPFS